MTAQDTFDALKYHIVIDEIGTRRYYNAVGLLDRVDGPAAEWADGGKEWWVNGIRHRIDGPAVEDAGYRAWFVNGKRHRIDGPAVEWADGGKNWYIDGKRYPEEEFNALVKK